MADQNFGVSDANSWGQDSSNYSTKTKMAMKQRMVNPSHHEGMMEHMGTITPMNGLPVSPSRQSTPVLQKAEPESGTA